MQDSEKSSALERWAFGLFCAGVLGVTFSIGLGQSLIGASFLLTTCWVVRTRPRMRFGILSVAVVLFGVIAVLTAVWGANPERGISKLPRLAWWLTIPAAFLLVRTCGRLLLLLRLFTVGCCILAAEACVVRPIAVLQRGMGEGGFLAQMIHMGSMTDGQMLMLGVLVAAVLVHLRVQQGGKARLEWAALALVMLGLLLNFKRGSWGCAVILAGPLAAKRLRKRGLAVVAAVLLVAFALPPVRARVAGVSEQFDVKSGARATMWLRVVPGLVREHPWGVGYGAVTYEIMREHSWRVERGRDHVHSNVLQVLVEVGWLGLAIYLLWMTKAVLDALMFRRLACAVSPAERAGAACLLLMLAGLLLNGLVEYNFGDTELLIIYGTIMGAAAAGRLRCASPTGDPSHSAETSIGQSAHPG